MYKQREGVEKAFDVYKNVLNADKMYLQDLMDEYAKVYKVEYGDKELMSEVPKRLGSWTRNLS